MKSADLTQLPAPAVRPKRRVPGCYTAIVIGGMIAGLVFGDRIFPEIEAAFGDPQTEILFGMLGALLASMTYDIVENIWGAIGR